MIQREGLLIREGCLVKCRDRHRDVMLPIGLERIGKFAFYRRRTTVTVFVPKGVTKIGVSAFEGCSKLVNARLPETLTQVSSSAFSGCEALKWVSVPEHAEIGKMAFFGCPGLANGQGFVIVNHRLFGYYGKGGDVKIPDSVTKIDCCAFQGCATVTAVTIPDSVTEIGEEAFSQCPNLADQDGFVIIRNRLFGYYGSGGNVTLPDHVKEIDSGAFQKSKPITGLIIPAGVKKIPKNVLQCCTSLQTIVVQNPAVLPADYQLLAVRTFLSRPDCDQDPCCAAYFKVIKRNVRKWMQSAMEMPELLSLMCRQKMISPTLLPEYEEAAREMGKAECIATLLNYSHLTMTVDEKERAEQKKNEEEDAVFERKLQRAQKQGVDGLVFVVAGRLSTFQNKKELKACLEQCGAKLVDTVSTDVDYLIWNGGTRTQSIQRAEELGIDIIPETYCNQLMGRNFVIRNGVLVRFIGHSGDVQIPQGVTAIGDDAFKDSWLVTAVEIPETVTRIGTAAFKSCLALTGIVIPGSVTHLQEETFANCLALTEVTLPEQLCEIGRAAFENCVALEQVNLPERLVTIEDDAFCGCTALKELFIPGAVQLIGSRAFQGCSSMTALCIAKGKVSILSKAFKDCSSLQEVVVPEGIRTLKTGTFESCTALTRVVLPEGLKVVEPDVFRDCTSLTGISLPDSVTELGRTVFFGCTDLQSINLPKNLTRLPQYVFAGCSSLTKVTIYPRVTEIGTGTFYGCTQLTICGYGGSHAQTFANLKKIPFEALP